jgi:Abnormal spindle-like microcephaly-assoc'd, ASPM-SPD-2-Hydin
MEFLRALRWLVSVVCALALPLPAFASFHTFQIQQLYSNADGSIQFIVMTEGAGFSGQNFLTGHVITSTQGATQHKLAFTQDLPSGNTVHRSFLIATPGFAALGIVNPDYMVPAGFLFTDGGTVNYADVDQVTYTTLPTDGTNALSRNGSVVPNLARNFAGTSGSVVPAGPPSPTTVSVIEYHNATYDSYFITPVAAEIALLDAAAPPFQAWSRTGLSFNAWVNATAPAGSVGICRFNNSNFAPNISHFYAPHGLGCETTLASFPDFKLEDDKLFNAMVPDATGACPAGTVPVYRMFNRYLGGAPNHRFVTDLPNRQAMLDKGYVAEGNGIGVGMCVPPVSTDPAGHLALSNTIAFVARTVGTTSAAFDETITNTGGSPLTVASAVSSNPAEFAITNNTCTTLAPGAACAVSVTFMPSTAGTRNATITVTSNDVASPMAVAASGIGYAGATPPTVAVIEYHNSTFDSYFITPVAAEIALLDAAAPPFQAWSRTGLSFNGYVNATAPVGSVGICRFNDSDFAPNISHFYAPHGLGCETTIASLPDFKLEDDKLFNAVLPDANGGCAAGTIPVYRLFNNNQGGAPNHRFVTSLTDRQSMLDKGFTAEGAGIGVGWCAPS